jgi:hypothetical protein
LILTEREKQPRFFYTALIIKKGVTVAKICLCLTAKTIGRDLEILDKYRKYADLAELRVDCLDPDERFLIRRFPALAGLPVILTIRRNVDGGRYSGGEGARVNLLRGGLPTRKPTGGGILPILILKTTSMCRALRKPPALSVHGSSVPITI